MLGTFATDRLPTFDHWEHFLATMITLLRNSCISIRKFACLVRQFYAFLLVFQGSKTAIRNFYTDSVNISKVQNSRIASSFQSHCDYRGCPFLLLRNCKLKVNMINQNLHWNNVKLQKLLMKFLFWNTKNCSDEYSHWIFNSNNVSYITDSVVELGNYVENSQTTKLSRIGIRTLELSQRCVNENIQFVI